MHVTLSKQSIYQAVQRCQNVVERRHTVPILSNLLLEAKGEHLQITSTDLEVGLKAKVKAEVEKDGSITVSARKLYEIVKELDKDAMVQLSLDSSFLHIRSGKSKFRLSTLPANEYPAMNEDIDIDPVHINGQDLSRMIATTSFAMSNDETRKYLTGTLFELQKPSHFKLVATDGHRLSLSEVKLQTIPHNLKCIVPKKAVIELRKLTEEVKGQVNLYLGKRSIRLEDENFCLISKLVDARFPAYDEVIPSDESDGATLSRQSLDQVLRRIMIVSNEFTHDAQLQFNQGELRILAHNTEQEEAEETIEIEYTGADLTIGFNARYLRDVLAVIQGEKIRIQLKDNLSPALILDESRDSERYVIMPMRI
ncbi:MAG: DNA polymerase III subunit beta [Mariprofundaceae bacterium]